MRFDGATYQPELDAPRLHSELERVRELMRDGQWRSLYEIKVAIGGGSEAGISARLRDLRKQEFGGHIVERRRRGNPKAGLWEYRLLGRVVQGEIAL